MWSGTQAGGQTITTTCEITTIELDYYKFLLLDENSPGVWGYPKENHQYIKNGRQNFVF